MKDAEKEREAVAAWLRARLKEKLTPGEIGIFVRSDNELPRALAAAETAGIAFVVLDEKMDAAGSRASISTMHLAKGLEFRAVVVMACDDEVIPLRERIETAADQGELEEVHATERHLLYVACTRARDHLLIAGVDPASAPRNARAATGSAHLATGGPAQLRKCAATIMRGDTGHSRRQGIGAKQPPDHLLTDSLIRSPPT